jgi:PqqD family protein of HPr-rel-A system
MAGSRFVADADILAATVPMEGLTVLFHAASGQTHILAPPAPQILAAIAGAPGDAGEILARIGERFDVRAEDAGVALDARLAELEAAGLVNRA